MNGNPKKALFFVNQVIQNNWSRAVLLNFLDTDLYERQGKAITNFNLTLPAMQSDLAQEITKDPYKFDFITLTQSYNEKELKDALMDNIQKFLLELGNGFAFVAYFNGRFYVFIRHSSYLLKVNLSVIIISYFAVIYNKQGDIQLN